MEKPVLSVILPVYNSEPYVTRAIESILTQTFSNFELIIINDCSTDHSAEKIIAFTDPRIIYLVNPENKGLVFTLNKGIEQAKGKYIARMDSDDISLPERFAAQVKWLEEHPETSVAGCHVRFIDGQDTPTGHWPLEMKTTDYRSIKKALPKENCIAHPSIMGVANHLKEFKYDNKQKNIEDYDLWLRLIAAGKVIEKVPATLLHYRVHAQSVTSLYLKNSNPFLKNFHCKRVFIAGQLRKGKLNGFIFRVFIGMLLDGVKAQLKRIKNIFR